MEWNLLECKSDKIIANLKTTKIIPGEQKENMEKEMIETLKINKRDI